MAKVYLSSVQGSKYKAYRGVTEHQGRRATHGEALQEDVKGSARRSTPAPR